MARMVVVDLSTVVAYGLKDASSWWDQINESPIWQDRLYHVLVALYDIIAIVALLGSDFSHLLIPGGRLHIMFLSRLLRILIIMPLPQKRVHPLDSALWRAWGSTVGFPFYGATFNSIGQIGKPLVYGLVVAHLSG
ncbi:hypothetical protein U1Q18_012657 [Sarracenia purpurea var. burkii]